MFFILSHEVSSRSCANLTKSPTVFIEPFSIRFVFNFGDTLSRVRAMLSSSDNVGDLFTLALGLRPVGLSGFATTPTSFPLIRVPERFT